MKNIFYILSFLFFVYCSKSPQIQNDLTELDLKGKVKSVIETSYPKTHRYWDQKDFEYYFDNNGYLKKKIEYSFNTYKQFEYDKKNQVSEINHYDLNDSLIFKTKFSYDNQKLSNQKVFNSKNEIVQNVSYEYSKITDTSNLVVEKAYNHKGEIIHHNSNLKNQKGQDLKWNEFNLKGQLQFSHDLTYNKNGKIIEYKKMDSINNLKWKWNKVYNSKNLETERKLYNPNLNKETIRISTYKYDNHGNWIIKHLIQNNDTLKTLNREIKYY
ncbi:hypothetical protein [uncultured Lutibacter sp.]|uniref:hypothetical protein n=1 Tax=uncultured Lutibacter sp. TaxID=437739 RepID=UPI0026247F40|nr:hypothetical protein [uncultured Lutibacter sp.]